LKKGKRSLKEKVRANLMALWGYEWVGCGYYAVNRHHGTQTV
jgi:hypothetical protein